MVAGGIRIQPVQHGPGHGALVPAGRGGFRYIALAGIHNDGPSGSVPAHVEIQGGAQVPELKEVVAVDGIGGKGHGLAVQPHRGGVGHGGLSSLGQGPQLASDGLIGPAGGQVDALFCPIPGDGEPLAGALEQLGHVTELDIVIVGNVVRPQLHGRPVQGQVDVPRLGGNFANSQSGRGEAQDQRQQCPQGAGRG